MLHAPLFPGKVELQQLQLIMDVLGPLSSKTWPGFDKLPYANMIATCEKTL